MAIDEKQLTKGQVRKLNALRKSVGDDLGESVFSKWFDQHKERLARQQAAKAARNPKPDPIVARIEKALSSLKNDSSFRLGNHGYTIKRARGKGKSGSFSITKNEKPA